MTCVLAGNGARPKMSLRDERSAKDMKRSLIMMSRISVLCGFGLIALSLLGLGCGDPFIEPLPPRDRIHWPIGLEVHPDGRYLYVVNTNFDTRYREDVGGTVSVIDLESLSLLPTNGPFIPSFGGMLKLNARASKAYVAIRSENQLLALDVSSDGSTVACERNGELSTDVSTCAIQRLPDRDGGAQIPIDPFGLDILTLSNLEITIEASTLGTYRIVLSAFGGQEIAEIESTGGDTPETIATDLASEIDGLSAYAATTQGATIRLQRVDQLPFEHLLDVPQVNEMSEVVDAASSFDAGFDIIGLSHLRGNNVSALSIPGGDLGAASLGFAELVSGSNDVALRPGTRDFYAAGRLSRQIAIFRPVLNPAGQIEAIINRGSIPLNNVTNVVDSRALEFEPDGQILYVATRNPDALHIIDLGPSDPETNTGSLGRVVDSIPLDRRPSDVVRHETRDGRVLLYVPCFEAQVIQVVDPNLGAIVDEISVGASPYAIAFDRGQKCVSENFGCRAYVSLFDDLPTAGGTCTTDRDQPCGSIGVIELDPESDRYHRLIAKID